MILNSGEAAGVMSFLSRVGKDGPLPPQESLEALRLYRTGLDYAAVAVAMGRDRGKVTEAIIREDLAEEARLVAQEDEETRTLDRLIKKSRI